MLAYGFPLQTFGRRAAADSALDLRPRPPQQVALRCRIVLASSQGLSVVAIAKQLSVNRKMVILWRQRFAQQRLDGLWEIAPGRRRKPRYSIDKIAAIVDATLRTKPEAMTHWSCRTMSKGPRKNNFTVGA